MSGKWPGEQEPSGGCACLLCTRSDYSIFFGGPAMHTNEFGYDI